MLFVSGARLDATLSDGRSLEIALEGVREHKGRLLVTLSGVKSANDAEQFAGATLYADADRIVLDPGEYLDRDLAGCELFDESGAPLGKVERVEHYPSSDMLIVGGRMVPMVAAFIKSVDTQSKRIVVDLPPGLLSDEE